MKKAGTNASDRTMAKKASVTNGAKKTKQRRKRKPTAPEIPEKLRKLTLKAFRLAYEAHHRKSS